MTELKTNELQTAINEIEKQISDKQNEKRNLQSQKSKLEFSIKNLETEVEKLQKELTDKRREYFNNLLSYAKERIEALTPESYGIAKEEDFVMFKKYDNYYLFSQEDSELIEISEKGNLVRIYDLKMYEDLLDDVKSDSYDRDTFLRRQRIDEIENYYYNDSLADYLYGIGISEVDLDDLLDDESEYMKGDEIEELRDFIEADEQYFTQKELYTLRDEDETNQ